jgi:hypothetical protein
MLRKMLFATHITLLRSGKCCGKCYLLPISHSYGAENVVENAICYPHIYPYYAPNGAENAICYPYHTPTERKMLRKMLFATHITPLMGLVMLLLPDIIRRNSYLIEVFC